MVSVAIFYKLRIEVMVKIYHLIPGNPAYQGPANGHAEAHCCRCDQALFGDWWKPADDPEMGCSLKGNSKQECWCAAQQKTRPEVGIWKGRFNQFSKGKEYVVPFVLHSAFFGYQCHGALNLLGNVNAQSDSYNWLWGPAFTPSWAQ